MKILVLHNEYATLSGEETSLRHVTDVLASRGHQVRSYSRSSAEITGTRLGKPRALLSGLFSPFSRAAVRKLLISFAPDVVFVKNLYPLISPSVLPVVRRAGVPIIMRVANYRLVCPNGLHLSRGAVCERCAGGREYWCALRNCEQSLPKSFGYALRNWIARHAGWYRENVSVYTCATEFMKRKLISAGFAASRIHVLPNVVPDPVRPGDVLEPGSGSFVGYVGRISKEKGVSTLIRAAALCPSIEFRLAGRVSHSLPLSDALPENVKLVGFLEGLELAEFFKQARIIVSPSECYETFGMTLAEAMLYARPVIASRIGVFPEWIQEGENGLLFEPGNPTELAAKIRHLWNQPRLCRAIGRAARAKASCDYSPERCYRRFMKACRHAVVLAGEGKGDRADAA